ncbi:MAG: 30S ribosomal protein S7 [Candidatus Altiarchaeota archaeon]|nr:30S ribosomal protein S7 [Candidatus Altiarchaeota archaeon]
MVDEIKLFSKWSFDGIKVRDRSLKAYINLRPIITPHTGGKWQKKLFGRGKYNIVELFVNKLMVTGHNKAGKKHVFTSGRNTGKKMMVMSHVESAFGLIEKKTKQNPIQILIRAVEHSAPKMEITTVEYGGMRTPVAVDASPLRRLSLAMSYLTKGAAKKSNMKKTTLTQAIAQELIAAADNDASASFAVDRKTMSEKQAEASR